MPTVYDLPPTLTLLPSNPWPQQGSWTLPKEREVNRGTLLDVAPDREILFLSRRSIAELRHTLKIRVGITEKYTLSSCKSYFLTYHLSCSRWVYRNHTRANATLRDGNPRISTLIRGPSKEPRSSTKKEIHVLRRVLSASALAPLTQPLRLDGHYISPDSEQDVDVWGTVTLSSDERLISPRPLGPTHILVIHSIPGPSRIFQPVTGGGRKALRRKQSSSLFHVTEIPINDLLFVLNLPNLAPSVPILPPRLHKELPRVLMFVPHIDTFPELVVYLHTQNQAELMRNTVPEWIRDFMHPLPESVDASSISETATTLDGIAIVKAPLHILGLLIPGVAPGPGTENLSMTQYDPCPRNEFKRTVETVAKEVAQAAHHSYGSEKEDADPILATVAKLNALRDNLEYIGYFSHALWHELNVYREVLIKAISYQARIQAAEFKS
ncbi:hypothetical protein H0H87_010833 [Tephrocybe sp. NHM501043]|nr:hypothetical protein H0H87_010833 [Tephrocybe sp. NHM501043]